VLLALVLGLAAGIAIALSQRPGLIALASAFAPIGTLWVNAVLMTVLPLVVSSLIVGVGDTADAGAVARLGWRAVIVMLATLFVTTAVIAAIFPPLVRLLPVDPGAAAALRGSSATTTPTVGPLTLGQWLTSLLPANPVKAAADGAMLPLVIYTLIIALAIAQLGDETRRALLTLARGVSQAMRVVVGWVLLVSPIGVFALAIDLGARLGARSAGALGYFVALSIGASVVLVAILALGAALFGGVTPAAFMRAAAPAQAVAISSRSSLAALPALVRSAEERLQLPPTVTGFFLPLAVATFRAGSPISSLGGTLFMAHVYGVPLSTAQVLELIPLAVAISFAVPGVPGGTVLAQAPMFVAAGIPAEGIGILLALDAIPDMCRTTVNVTGDVTAACILGRAPRVSKTS